MEHKKLYIRLRRIIYHLYVVYDLACSPLLVDILVEYMLVTPRGSIYDR
jgi:hypothetical protein